LSEFCRCLTTVIGVLVDDVLDYRHSGLSSLWFCHRVGVSPIFLGLSVVSIIILSLFGKCLHLVPCHHCIAFQINHSTCSYKVPLQSNSRVPSSVCVKRNQKPAGESDRIRSRRLIITTHIVAQVNLLLAPMSAPWTPSLGQPAQSVTQGCLFVFRFYLRTSYLWSVLRISLLESRAD